MHHTTEITSNKHLSRPSTVIVW